MLAPEGYPTIIIVSLFSTVGIITGILLQDWPGALLITLSVSVCLFVVLFFRDPDRDSPEGDAYIIAPADGRVVVIKETYDSLITGGKGTQVSIFLSLANVHVNRIPVTGTVEQVDYFPGKFLTAWKEEASELNERAHFLIQHRSGKRILFKQITGLLARRIVYHIQQGDEVKAGDRFGIMKFGSRMDIILPEGIQLKVKNGDRTVGGVTILGIIQS